MSTKVLVDLNKCKTLQKQCSKSGLANIIHHDGLKVLNQFLNLSHFRNPEPNTADTKYSCRKTLHSISNITVNLLSIYLQSYLWLCIGGKRGGAEGKKKKRKRREEKDK